MAQAVKTTYYTNSKFKCLNCNSEYELGSTVEEMSLEVCGNCHPFYTGQDTILDTAGRIERFQARLSKAQDLQAKGKKVKKRKVRQTLADLEDSQETEVTAPKADSKS
jgi:large subunit ribosomal protein L31